MNKSVRHSKTQSRNTKKVEIVKYRNWDFVVNNYSEQDIEIMKEYLDTNNCQYYFQEEVGEKGTPHLQGIIMFKHARDKKAIIKKSLGDKISLRKVRNLNACKNYVKKKGGGSFWSNMDEVEVIEDYWDPKLEKPWQTKVLAICAGKVDSRAIYWFWESKGNVGKTTLARHMCMTDKRCLYVCGKIDNIKFAFATMKKKPRVVIWDLSRTQRISYTAIEQIKNGIFFSQKYESGQVIYNKPHIIIFANWEPEYDSLSEDMWRVERISPN